MLGVIKLSEKKIGSTVAEFVLPHQSKGQGGRAVDVVVVVSRSDARSKSIKLMSMVSVRGG